MSRGLSAAAAATAASFATFDGMQTNEDLSSAQAAQVAREQGEEDEIVQEIPIVLSQELAHTLYLMQSPLRPPHRPYDSELGARVSLQVKPIQKKVEMEYRLEEAGVMYQAGVPMSSGVKSEVARGHNFDEHHEHSNVKTVKLSGKNVQPKTNYAVGVLSQGVLHLTPLSAVCRFRPQLNYIDEAQAAAAASSEAAREAHRAERLMSGRMTEEEELEAEEEEYARVKAEEEKKQLQTVVMKVERKRAGAATSAAGNAGGAAGAPGAAGAAPGVGAGGTMRKQTYAYIKQLEESEKWIPLKMHEQDTPASTAQYTRLLSPLVPAPPVIPFNVPAQLYLSYVNPPDTASVEAAAAAGETGMQVAAGDARHMPFEQRVVQFLRHARMIHLGELCRKMHIGSPQQLEHALQLLGQMCWLVQGCWVIKSAVLADRAWQPGMPVPPPTVAPASTYANPAMAAAAASAAGSLRSSLGSLSGGAATGRPVAERAQLARDFVLTQFAKRRVLARDELNATLLLELEPLEALLDELAVQVPLDAASAAAGLPPRGVWEWKLPTDTESLRRHFPREVAAAEAALLPLESELRALLTPTHAHPSRDAATRGLQLVDSARIIHNLAPAGLAANRALPNQDYKPNEAERQAATVVKTELLLGGAAAAARAAAASALAAASSPAAASSTAGAGSAPLLSTAEVESLWSSHLAALFAEHGVLHSSFAQQSLASVAARASDAAAAVSALQDSLAASSARFGPLDQMLMASSGPAAEEKYRGHAAHRQAVAALFASSSSVTTAALRAALPARGVTDERRRDIIKEFAIYQASTQSWKLKPGQPATE